MDPFKSRYHPRSSDKMVNVILNVRNRRYNGEDASKPPLSFACMIFMAVESSPTKTLPVKGIYDWVMWKFPYYRDAPPGWKNSVRHNLSLNKCFKKVDRYSAKVSRDVLILGKTFIRCLLGCAANMSDASLCCWLVKDWW